MPSAGLQIFGAGLRLQPNTPGAIDQGNANISGTFIAGEEIYTDHTPTGGGSNCLRFGKATSVVKSPASQGITVLGSAASVVGLPGVSDATVIGAAAKAGSGGGGGGLSCVVIGSQAQAGLGVTAGHIAIGKGALASGSGTRPCVVIGLSATVASGDGAVVIGDGTPTFQTNVTYLGFGAAARSTQNNEVIVGNASVTRVVLGPYVIDSGMAATQFCATDSTTVANSAAETEIAGTGIGTLTIPAGRLKVGTTIRFTVRGIIADTGTPTVQFRIKIGPNTFMDFGAVAFPTMVGTHGFEIKGEVTVRTIGAGGTAIGNGVATVSVSGAPDLDTINTATVAIDTTVARTISITAQWGTADAANTLTRTHTIIELLGP